MEAFEQTIRSYASKMEEIQQVTEQKKALRNQLRMKVEMQKSELQMKM